jgi:hypothetical protein
MYNPRGTACAAVAGNRLLKTGAESADTAEGTVVGMAAGTVLLVRGGAIRKIPPYLRGTPGSSRQ